MPNMMKTGQKIIKRKRKVVRKQVKFTCDADKTEISEVDKLLSGHEQICHCLSPMSLRNLLIMTMSLMIVYVACVKNPNKVTPICMIQTTLQKWQIKTLTPMIKARVSRRQQR